jgi:DNA processing protein
MISHLKQLTPDEFPALLKEISDPPEELFLMGDMPDEEYALLCVVGSRKHTSYGKDACEKIISGLSGYPIAIVSGLAIGIDSIAHRAAIRAKLKTIAIPGSGLNSDVIYPAMNRGLARDILKHGGALLSPFKPDFRATQWSFPARNRIMAGISRAVLVIEAEERSGTLITARLALDYNRDVYAVPGSIFSAASRGTNTLIAQGAVPVTASEDILRELGLETRHPEETVLPADVSPKEQEIWDLLREPMERDSLIDALGMPISETNGVLALMEIKGIIRESGGKIYRK